jgi:hypothetical protein
MESRQCTFRSSRRPRPCRRWAPRGRYLARAWPKSVTRLRGSPTKVGFVPVFVFVRVAVRVFVQVRGDTQGVCRWGAGV